MQLVSLAVCALRVLCSRKRVKLIHQYLDFILSGFSDPNELTDLEMGRNMRSSDSILGMVAASEQYDIFNILVVTVDTVIAL